jgi:hypothetical protein
MFEMLDEWFGIEQSRVLNLVSPSSPMGKAPHLYKTQITKSNLRQASARQVFLETSDVITSCPM